MFRHLYAFVRRAVWLPALLLLAGWMSQGTTPPPATMGARFAGVTFRRVTDTFGPWRNVYGLFGVTPYVDGPRDSTGVRVVIRNGVMYNHPVAQAQDGLGALARYRANPSVNAYLLTRAEKEGQRLIDTHLTNSLTGSAWWFPYPFVFEEYGDPALTVYPPWFSGMAQGEALDLFTQLFIVTGGTAWQSAAAHAYDSFLYPLHAGADIYKAPWVWRADSNEYLWIEEYPLPNPDDDTINGFGFAIYGLVDYARTFNSSGALLLAQGGIATFLHFIPVVRHPGGISSYSLSHMSDRPSNYHIIVTTQLSFFARATGDTQLEELAIEFYQDYHSVVPISP